MNAWFAEHWKKISVGVFVVGLLSVAFSFSTNTKTSVIESFEDCGLFDDEEEFEECLKEQGITLSDDFLALDEDLECEEDDPECEEAKKKLDECEKSGPPSGQAGKEDCFEEKQALIAAVEEKVEKPATTAQDLQTPAPSIGSVSGPTSPAGGPIAGPVSGPIAGPIASAVTSEKQKRNIRHKEKKEEREERKEREEKKETGEIRESAPQERAATETPVPNLLPEIPLLASIPPADGSTEPIQISIVDVSAEHVYAENIKKVAEKGIMTGTPDPEKPEQRSFKPDNPINRAEMATVLVRWLYKDRMDALMKAYTYQVSQKIFKGFCAFGDVPKDQWYAKNVWVACFQYIFKGYPDKTFQPDNSINQAEAIKVIVEAAARFSPKMVEPVLTEERKMSKKTEPWFEVYIRTAEKTGILTEEPLALMKTDPSALATRAWVAYAIAHIPGL